MAFFSRATPEEMLRKNQRALTRAMRELDRERSKLEQQEKKLILDIKKMAKAGQMDAVKIMARDLVRTRSYIKKFITMRANIQAISLKVQTLKSQASMANAMKGVTQAMKRMNNKMNLPQIQKIMMEFEKQSEIMDMKEEVMNDAIDEVIGEFYSQWNLYIFRTPKRLAKNVCYVEVVASGGSRGDRGIYPPPPDLVWWPGLRPWTSLGGLQRPPYPQLG